MTSLTIVYSTVHSGADERSHQSSASLVFVRGIHSEKCLSLMTGSWKNSICFSCEYYVLNTAHKSCVILQLHNAKSMRNDELNETLAKKKNGLISTGYHNVFAMIFSNEPCKFYSASDRKTSWSLSFLQTHLLQGISRRNSTPFSTFHQGQANGSRCAISVSCMKLDVTRKGCFFVNMTPIPRIPITSWYRAYSWQSGNTSPYKDVCGD